jgi:hypothetical protein
LANEGVFRQAIECFFKPLKLRGFGVSVGNKYAVEKTATKWINQQPISS